MKNLINKDINNIKNNIKNNIDILANIILMNIVKFRKLYNDYKDVKLPHIPINIRKPGSAKSQAITIKLTD